MHRDALGVPLQTVDYVYDLFDRRIGKSDTPAGGPTEVQVYVYDGACVALRFIDGQLANRYLHGQAIDQILADEQVDSLSSPGEVLWPLTDHLGTVRDLAVHDDGTNTTSIANHLAYDAFGRVTSQSNAAVDHLFGYTGREWDSAVDLQYNRARWYDPSIGRWLSEDPIGFAAGDAHLYRYVGNSATSATDPTGLWTWSDYFGAFGDSYGAFVNPWDDSGPPPVDWIDSTLTFGTQAGQATGVVAGVAAGGVAIAGAAGITASGAAIGIGTEIVDTAAEEGLSYATGLPIILPMSPVDIAQDGGMFLCRRFWMNSDLAPTITSTFSGPGRPWTQGATPNSIYTYQTGNGTAVQNAIYNQNGDIIGHVDFNNHGINAPSGHGHIFPVPGDPSSGHYPGAPHIPPNQLPPGWGHLPPGVQPSTPIGQ